jgi:hypothetical protein
LALRVANETEHRDFSFHELEELEQDLVKLKRWIDQVRARDYFPDSASVSAEQLLERCDNALSDFLVHAAARDPST